jgi:hypothetical protein
MQRETQPPPSSDHRAEKKPWETPKLSYVGAVEDVVQQGDGKLTAVAADPGEHKKTKPSG